MWRCCMRNTSISLGLNDVCDALAATRGALASIRDEDKISSNSRCHRTRCCGVHGESALPENGGLRVGVEGEMDRARRKTVGLSRYRDAAGGSSGGLVWGESDGAGGPNGLDRGADCLAGALRSWGMTGGRD